MNSGNNALNTNHESTLHNCRWRVRGIRFKKLGDSEEVSGENAFSTRYLPKSKKTSSDWRSEDWPPNWNSCVDERFCCLRFVIQRAKYDLKPRLLSCLTPLWRWRTSDCGYKVDEKESTNISISERLVYRTDEAFVNPE